MLFLFTGFILDVFSFSNCFFFFWELETSFSTVFFSKGFFFFVEGFFFHFFFLNVFLFCVFFSDVFLFV